MRSNPIQATRLKAYHQSSDPGRHLNTKKRIDLSSSSAVAESSPTSSRVPRNPPAAERIGISREALFDQGVLRSMSRISIIRIEIPGPREESPRYSSQARQNNETPPPDADRHRTTEGHQTSGGGEGRRRRGESGASGEKKS